MSFHKKLGGRENGRSPEKGCFLLGELSLPIFWLPLGGGNLRLPILGLPLGGGNLCLPVLRLPLAPRVVGLVAEMELAVVVKLPDTAPPNLPSL
jgi:hypothetical protein